MPKPQGVGRGVAEGWGGRQQFQGQIRVLALMDVQRRNQGAGGLGASARSRSVGTNWAGAATNGPRQAALRLAAPLRDLLAWRRLSPGRGPQMGAPAVGRREHEAHNSKYLQENQVERATSRRLRY
jgi:hypothetical protein